MAECDRASVACPRPGECEHHWITPDHVLTSVPRRLPAVCRKCLARAELIVGSGGVGEYARLRAQRRQLGLE